MTKGFFPWNSLTITWKDPANKPLTDFVQHRPFRNDRGYSKFSQLRVKNSEWKPQTSYTCEASNSMGTVRDTITRPVPQPNQPATVFLTVPTKKDLENGKATFLCLAQQFSPKTYSFKWFKDENQVTNAINTYDASKKIDSVTLYSTTSILQISAEEWKTGAKSKCEFEHKMGKQVKEAEYTDEKTPNVIIYRPDIINKDSVSLVCEVTSPKLGDVYIMWKVGEKSIEATTSLPIHQKSSTSVLSILTVSKQEYEDHRTTITCAVKHPNMENTSAPLQVSTSQREPPEPEKGFALNCNNDVLEEDEFRSLWSTATSFIFLFLFSLTYSAVLSLLRLKQ
ncbi:hypothetical protein ABG768_019589 [Culter alburnus]|uniref:Ig-like domain-containing protein n=1 Tax=Culter alburnus TaxID=194366 RepID=A0AAW2AWM8_CULAL